MISTDLINPVAMRGCATRHESYLLTISSLCAISAYDMPALAMTWPRVPPPLAVIAASAVLQLRTSLRVQMCVRASCSRSLGTHFALPPVQYFDSEDRGGNYGRDRYDEVSLPATSPPRRVLSSSAVCGARGEKEPRAPTGPTLTESDTQPVALRHRMRALSARTSGSRGAASRRGRSTKLLARRR